MKSLVKRIIFIGLILIGALCVMLMRTPLHLQTDLTSMLNIANSDDWPITDITNKYSNIVNVLIETPDQMGGEIAANQVRNITNEFSGLEIMTTGISPREFVNELGAYKNFMLSSQYRELLLNKNYAAVLDNVKNRVESSVAPNMLPLSHDPFMLVTDYVSNMNTGNTNWIVQDGVLWQYRAPNNYYMLPINVNIADNAEMANTVAKLKSRVMDLATNNVKIYIGGAPVHTAEMYNHSKIEISVLSIIALLMIVVLNYGLFRKFKTIIPIALSLAVGYFTGTIALFLCFSAPHVLVFVFGTTLVGLGIDYSFHTISNTDKNTDKSILHSLITTVICFVPLLFASIDLLRQISVFTITGLIAIYLFIKLFVNLRVKPTNTKNITITNKKYRPYIIGTLCAITIAAVCFAKIENNMAALYRPHGELATAEKIIGKLNQTTSSAFLVVRGHDVQEVLETSESLRDNGVQFFGISNVIPSLKRQAENQELVKQLYASQAKKIKTALGLRTTPKFTETGALTLENAGAIGDTMQKFLMENGDYIYSISMIYDTPTINNPNARVIMPAKIIEQTMSKYSTQAYRLLLVCGVALLIALFAIYRGRAIKYLTPALLGADIAIGVMTILGMPLTFFHLLSLFIVIGLGLDYAIFHINTNSAADTRATLYSFLTSFIGFGLLAFTSFFLIAAMGITLAIGIAVAYLTSLYLFRGGTNKAR